mgnify:CR=1 FL=1
MELQERKQGDQEGGSHRLILSPLTSPHLKPESELCDKCCYWNNSGDMVPVNTGN